MSSIGIDIGGSKIALGLVEENKILYTKLLKNTFSGCPDDMVEAISEELNCLHKQSLSMVEGVGVGCPGWVIDGIVYDANNLGISRYELKNKLAQACGLNVFLENDARTALLCEWKFGSLKESTNGALVTFGTGIGGALLLNKRLYTGSFGYAGEIGHATTGNPNDLCSCGKKGCFELYAAMPALVNYAKLNGLWVENGEAVFEMAQKGTPAAQQAVERFISEAAHGIIELAMLLDLDTIAVGGAVSRRWKEFVYPIQELVSHYSPHCSVVPSVYGNDAGIIGAALLTE